MTGVITTDVIYGAMTTSLCSWIIIPAYSKCLCASDMFVFCFEPSYCACASASIVYSKKSNCSSPRKAMNMTRFDFYFLHNTSSHSKAFSVKIFPSK
jgi:hypothetical protein